MVIPLSNEGFPCKIRIAMIGKREVLLMKSKKTRKIIVYLMLIAMLASTLLIGIGQFLS